MNTREVFVSDGVKGKLAKRVPLVANYEGSTPTDIIDSVSLLFGAQCRFVYEVRADGLRVEIPSILRGGEQLIVEYQYWDARFTVSSLQDSVRSTIATLARSKGLDGFCARSHAVDVEVAIFSVNQDLIQQFVDDLPQHLGTGCSVRVLEPKQSWGALQGHFVHHKGGVARQTGDSPDKESGTSGATGMSDAALGMYV